MKDDKSLEKRRAPGLSTRSIHAGLASRALGEPVAPPIVQSSTFFGGRGGDGEELLYSRYGNNPNQLRVQEKLAALEGTEAALALSSGMAAIAMAVLALMESGDHIVASEQLYGATRKLFERELPRRGIRTTFVDFTSLDEVESSIRPETRIIYFETPANPTLRVHDPTPVVGMARSMGILTAVDATFASPVNVRLAEHGIDLIIHSATKYLGGHSDLIAGAVAGSRELIERVRGMMILYGPSIDPHAAWLLDRGLRTLTLRVQRQNDGAMTLARWFQGRPEVASVVYPGLPTHPDHAVAAGLLDGFGGMLALVLRGGGEAADAFVDRLELGLVAPSLGGVETLVSQPRYTSHIALSPGARERLGIPDGFVRISVGTEDVADLVDDFAQAFEGSEAATPPP